MDLTVYRQNLKERPDGTIVYKGEDARPFVDGRLLLVADGLGGASAIRHQKVNPDLFDRRKLLDIMFSGVYDDYSDGVFVNYVSDSFFEFFAVKDCYADNIYNVKTGGYFASRIVAAIVLHEIIYNANLSSDALFGESLFQDDGVKRQSFLENLGKFFSDKIGRDLRSIAKNCNLVYESSIKGMALLGTTLCAAVCRENDDSVDVVYLMAGDSRPYVWTKAEGLQQVIADEEGADGGMTNYIKANEGSSFSINCEYRRFAKPCVLFNASDGCFDSGAFLSQMAFEKLILESCVSSKDMDEMGRKLYDFFVENGKHDDSSTIAMKTFGFSAFEDFQKSAADRLKHLDDDYISKLPDILDRDYISEYKETSDSESPLLSDLRKMFDGRPDVLEYCVKKIMDNHYVPYETAMREIDDDIAKHKKSIKGLQEGIKEIISRNYVGFKPFLGSEGGFWEKMAVGKVQKIEESTKKQQEGFAAFIENFKTEFVQSADKLQSKIEQMRDFLASPDACDCDEESFSILNDCEDAMKAFAGLICSLTDKRNQIKATLDECRKNYISRNLKMASKNEEGVGKISDAIVSGEIDLSGVKLAVLSGDSGRLDHYIKDIDDLHKTISKLDGDDRKKSIGKCRDEYWGENYVQVVSDMLSDRSSGLSGELHDKAKEIIEKLNFQKGELKDRAELQANLFEQYDASYRRLMTGEAQ